jgi:uncharacterized protein (DUF1697 family)
MASNNNAGEVRYVAFLRGVSPMNAKMAELKNAFEQMGFSDVRTVLSSGNVVFSGIDRSESSLVKTIEAGMANYLPRSFPVIVRRIDHLAALLEQDPFSAFRISAKEKRVVTFLGEPYHGKLSLPIETDGVRILAMQGDDVFTVYAPHPKGPVFMTLLEKTFGKNITTRTWDTVKKCAVA